MAALTKGQTDAVNALIMNALKNPEVHPLIDDRVKLGISLMESFTEKQVTVINDMMQQAIGFTDAQTKVLDQRIMANVENQVGHMRTSIAGEFEAQKETVTDLYEKSRTAYHELTSTREALNSQIEEMKQLVATTDEKNRILTGYAERQQHEVNSLEEKIVGISALIKKS